MVAGMLPRVILRVLHPPGAIDPSFVMDGERLHCFFVGSDDLSTPQSANLLGHAVTQDPMLEK